MNHIRKATTADVSRIAEILVFTKRMNYRPIFRNDKVSFGEIQVLPLAQEYLKNPKLLDPIWVYDDEFVKGVLHVEDGWIQELYVDSFFQNQGIGAKLIDFAIQKCHAKSLFVLEKNTGAIRFYERHGFVLTKEQQLEPGTTEYIVRMEQVNFMKGRPKKNSRAQQRPSQSQKRIGISVSKYFPNRGNT